MNSKGQQFATDFILGVTLFMLLFSLTFYFWDKSIYNIQKKEAIGDLLFRSQQMADILVMTQGTPNEWESDPEASESIGLVRDESRVLDFVKLNTFLGMNYSYSKEVLGIGTYDYQFELIDLKGNILNESGKPPSGDFRVEVHRYIFYEDSPAIIKLNVWGIPMAGTLDPIPPI
ncbi:MAG: hypothetical protein ABH950_08120 [Candidatus Altiarchaeota archaeon]